MVLVSDSSAQGSAGGEAAGGQRRATAPQSHVSLMFYFGEAGGWVPELNAKAPGPEGRASSAWIGQCLRPVCSKIARHISHSTAATSQTRGRHR